MEKVSYLMKRRFIILTNKNLFAYTSDDKSADCTMNLDVSDCKNINNSDKEISKVNTFVNKPSNLVRQYY